LRGRGIHLRIWSKIAFGSRLSWCIYTDLVPYCNSGIPFVFLSVAGWYGKCSCQKSACRQHKVPQSIEFLRLVLVVLVCWGVLWCR
jgi:hypothetical protein